MLYLRISVMNWDTAFLVYISCLPESKHNRNPKKNDHLRFHFNLFFGKIIFLNKSIRRAKVAMIRNDILQKAVTKMLCFSLVLKSTTIPIEI